MSIRILCQLTRAYNRDKILEKLCQTSCLQHTNIKVCWSSENGVPDNYVLKPRRSIMTMKKPSTDADNCRKHRHILAVKDPLLEQTRKRVREQSRCYRKGPQQSCCWGQFSLSKLCFAHRLAMWKCAEQNAFVKNKQKRCTIIFIMWCFCCCLYKIRSFYLLKIGEMLLCCNTDV